jgi:hypothetical protein
LFDIRAGERRVTGCGIHDIVIILLLEGLDGEVGDLKGALDAAEEGADLGDPEAFEMWGGSIRILQEWSTEAEVCWSWSRVIKSICCGCPGNLRCLVIR